MEALTQILRDIGVEADDIRADVRLRADLALDSTETASLELELERRFGVKVDLWDAKDFSLSELGALIEAAA
nr:acyl carrier protein [Microbispora rosea]